MKNGKHIDEDGAVRWYLNGQYHREDGPAIKFYDDSKQWWLDGKLHRVDGPAIENANGNKYWYLHDQRHREDGPAIEKSDGTRQWWITGQELLEEDFNQWLMKKTLNDKLHATLPHKPIIKRGKI